MEIIWNCIVKTMKLYENSIKNYMKLYEKIKRDA